MRVDRVAVPQRLHSCSRSSRSASGNSEPRPHIPTAGISSSSARHSHYSGRSRGGASFAPDNPLFQEFGCLVRCQVNLRQWLMHDAVTEGDADNHRVLSRARSGLRWLAPKKIPRLEHYIRFRLGSRSGWVSHVHLVPSPQMRHPLIPSSDKCWLLTRRGLASPTTDLPHLSWSRS